MIDDGTCDLILLVGSLLYSVLHPVEISLFLYSLLSNRTTTRSKRDFMTVWYISIIAYEENLSRVSYKKTFTIFFVLLELSEELRQKKDDLDCPFLSLLPTPLTHKPLDMAERLVSVGESE